MSHRGRCGTAAWRRLRVEVLERDGWRCVECGRAGRLEVHHLDHDPLNDDPDNLAAWCRDCHRDHHRRKRTETEREWDRHLATFET